MKLSTKGRYAVTAMADMAQQEAREDRPAGARVTLAEIAERQKISLAYLEQLFARLRRAALVESARGPGGGYRLAKPASDLTIAEIMSAVDETLRATGCDLKGAAGCCDGPEHCVTHDLWERLSAEVYLFLHGVSLEDVVEKRLAPCNAVPAFGVFDDDWRFASETAAAV